MRSGDSFRNKLTLQRLSRLLPSLLNPRSSPLPHQRPFPSARRALVPLWLISVSAVNPLPLRHSANR